jgi:small-conductance mechanosensitive channel
MVRKSQLDDYHRDLIDLRNKIDSLRSDPILYSFSSDSATYHSHLYKLTSPGTEPPDTAFEIALTNVSELQARVDHMVNKLNSSLEQIEIFKKGLASKTFDRELPNLGGPIVYIRPFAEILNVSGIKGRIALDYYMRVNKNKIILLLLLICVSTIFLTNLQRTLSSRQLLNENHSGQLVLRHPVLSATMIVLSIFQFIFPDPPFIFNALLWTISAICLTIIFRKVISKYWMQAWLIMFALFLLACADNLILIASRTERWMMLTLAVAGAVSSLVILALGHREQLREKWIVYFIGFVAITEIISIVANIFGRYNLSKTFLTSGLFNVIIALVLLWTVRLINEGLSLASRAYSMPDKKLFYINFERVGRKAPPIFYIFLFIGWFVLFARNFYAYKSIADPVRSFILQKRSIGDFSFTIGSLVEFFLLLILSTMISRVVSYFASDRLHGDGSDPQKRGIGSWLLLIRIAIIAMGLLLAFAAAGIPMDRLTIILSALGVGIGFGLQTIVNNLVSGLIISFEKPLNVGDIVDIGDKSGVVKSIGFRSSVIATWEGSYVVIPNGDLLNRHMVNWTHDNSTRRVDIRVGVSYGTDLEKTKKLLEDIMKEDERVLKFPAPSALASKFNNTAIEMRLLFWVKNIREWLKVKSDVISAIDIAFKAHDIVIRFPPPEPVPAPPKPV